MIMLEPVETAQDLNRIIVLLCFPVDNKVERSHLESTVGSSGPANQVSSRLASNTLQKDFQALANMIVLQIFKTSVVLTP